MLKSTKKLIEERKRQLKLDHTPKQRNIDYGIKTGHSKAAFHTEVTDWATTTTDKEKIIDCK